MNTLRPKINECIDVLLLNYARCGVVPSKCPLVCQQPPIHYKLGAPDRNRTCLPATVPFRSQYPIQRINLVDNNGNLTHFFLLCYKEISAQHQCITTVSPKFGGDGRIRTYSPEGTDLQSAATLQLSRISKFLYNWQLVCCATLIRNHFAQYTLGLVVRSDRWYLLVTVLSDSNR